MAPSSVWKVHIDGAARGNPNDPRPDAVWDQLWSILEENGALKTAKRK
jgi:hypothetical protein